jgi:RNA polymerase sigma-70 factor (ECF subfamily)
MAGGSSTSDGTAALEKLCRAYWFPIYAHARRRGYNPEDAQDLTQEFFAQLIARRDFANVERSKGKFRSFLLACLNHFLAKDWRGRNAIKRGGGQAFIPLDTALAEERLATDHQISGSMSSDRLYDQRWAMTVMEQSLDNLRQEWVKLDKGGLFEEFKIFLSEPAEDGAYASLAARLNMTPSAVATTIHRLRNRYRDLVRATLAQTVTTPLELEEEMRYLLEVLSEP